METTQVECVVLSCKQTKRWNNETKKWDAPPEHEIELDLPYDPSNIYYQFSGGTKTVLRTINQEAAALFKPGTKVMLSLTPIAE